MYTLQKLNVVKTVATKEEAEALEEKGFKQVGEPVTPLAMGNNQDEQPASPAGDGKQGEQLAPPASDDKQGEQLAPPAGDGKQDKKPAKGTKK